MSDKPVLQPGPDRPISVLANPSRVIVSVAGRMVANTDRALVLQEAAYPAVQYIPIADVDQSVLQRTDNSTYCPDKGDAGYYSITVGGERSVDATWTYESPYDAVAQIKDHVAFYPDRVDAIAEQLAG